MINIIPKIIVGFTYQIDASKEKACEVMSSMYKQVIGLGLALGTGFVSGAIGPYQADGEKLAWMAPQYGKEIGEARNRKSFDWFMTTANTIIGAAMNYLPSPFEKGPMAQAGINKGVGSGGICGRFQGSYKNTNGENIDAGRDYTENYIEEVKRVTEHWYETIYKGQVDPTTNTTLMSFLMFQRRWAGQDSVLEQLKDLRANQL